MDRTEGIPLDTTAVAGVLLSCAGPDGKILLLKRRDEGYWCHVAGRIEAGESAVATVLREFREETGAEIESLYSADYVDTFFDARINRLRLVPVFAAYWPDSDTDPVLDREHGEYCWCSLRKAVQLVPFPNQQRLLSHVWSHFVTRAPQRRLLIDKAHRQARHSVFLQDPAIPG